MSDTATKTTNTLYDTDFYAWTQEQARLLRERRFADLDLDNLIDEVESVGTSQRKEIRSRLKVLLAHLLKWKFQAGARSPSWRGTIDERREQIRELLEISPSLGPYPHAVFDKAYLSARLLASKESGIDFTLFPEAAPFTVEQALDEKFLPKQPDLYDQS